MSEILAYIVVALIAFVLGMVVWSSISDRRETRRQREAHNNRQWDPAWCDHVWEETERGTCMPDYSSVSTNPQEDWFVMRCPYCGTLSFRCNPSCSQFEECRQTYEAGTPAPGKITRTSQGIKADERGIAYAVYHLEDRFGNERTGYCRIVPVTRLNRCPDCGGTVEAIGGERVRPGGIGDAPSAFRCSGCGREESSDFAVASVSYEEADLTFVCPEGLHALPAQVIPGQPSATEEKVVSAGTRG